MSRPFVSITVLTGSKKAVSTDHYLPENRDTRSRRYRMHRIARRLAVLGLLPLGVAGLTLPAAHAEGGARTGATGLATASATASAAGSAATASASPRDRGYHTWRGASTSVQQRQVRQYWNRSRLRSAVPMEQILHGRRRSPARPGLPGSPGSGPGLPGASGPAG